LKQLYEEVSNSFIAELFGISKSKVQYKREKWNLLMRDLVIEKYVTEALEKDEEVDKIAKAITHFAFRSGPVEDMHVDGKLTQEDMKILNKYMVNRLACVFLLLRNKLILFDFIVELESMFVTDWDEAKPDDGGLTKILRMCKEDGEDIFKW